ncbi:MAG: hypothetical protein IT371_24895 [Deltaproteobacteria bacterium]|nr:hypothetical protein [Deltaproteobacteria bacterium]
MRWRVEYSTAEDLHAHLAENAARGAVLLPVPDGSPEELRQFARVELELRAGDWSGCAAGELLQLIPGVGAVIRVFELDALSSLPPQGATPPSGKAPEVRALHEEAATLEGSAGPSGDGLPATDGSDGSDDHERVLGQHYLPKGSTVLSWPVEKLQVEWPTLSVAEKIRVARYGKRPARAIALRSNDKNLHAFVLANAGVSVEEVAHLAGMAGADPAVLLRIAGTPEWLGHTAVVRNLVCHPKMPLPQVVRLLDHLPSDEIRRLTSSGRVRAALKREMIKKLERRGGR